MRKEDEPVENECRQPFIQKENNQETREIFLHLDNKADLLPEENKNKYGEEGPEEKKE